MAVVEQAELTLAQATDSPASARRFVEHRLRSWGVTESEIVLVLTSELVTNAVLHGDDPIHLVVQRLPGEIRVEVEDGSAAVPVLCDPDVTDLSGRGLRLVDRLSSAWGHEPRPTGKAVWFRVAS